ncbi:Cytochrome P450 71D10 [Linum perenne]
MTMDLGFDVLLLVAALIVGASASLVLVAKSMGVQNKTAGSTSSTTEPNLLPGPSTLPLLGNIHNLVFSTTFLHRSLHQLSLNYGPLFRLKLGQITLMVASTPEMAKQLLKHHDLTFAQRTPLLYPSLIFYDCSDILFSPYGQYWRQLRKVCHSQLFSPIRVDSFSSIRRDEVSNLIASVRKISSSSSSSKGGPASVNLSRLVFEASCGVTCRAAFGSKYDDLDTLKSLTSDIMQLASSLGLADLFPSNGNLLKVFSRMTNFRVNRVMRGTDKILEDILKDHRNNAPADGNTTIVENLVHVLLMLQRNADRDLPFPLSDNNIKAVLLDILVAGSQTSSATIGWIMSEIVKNPSVMERAQAEVTSVFNKNGPHDDHMDEDTAIQQLHFLKCCIKEAMRLHPPVALIVRESRTSCNVCAYDIPRKTLVAVNAWSTCRDPRYWSDAERFVPDRFLECASSVNYVEKDHFEFIPFGAGRRMCPGISFAMANIELSVAKLLYHFDWKLPGGINPQDLDMAERFGVTITRKNDLILIPVPRGSFVTD